MAEEVKQSSPKKNYHKPYVKKAPVDNATKEAPSKKPAVTSKPKPASVNNPKDMNQHKKTYPKSSSQKTNKPKASNDVKVYSLGGIGVIGMNIYCVEQDDEIIVMDAGILFADDDTHGVNYIIPDFTYLEQNEKKIVGLFITHGHEDHIGAIPFLLQKVKIPTIYASGLAVHLINNKLSEFPNLKYHMEEFTDDSIYKFKHFELSFFRTNHSIPDSFGIAIKTKLGYVVNTGDFKFDLTPLGHPTDFNKITRLGELGVYCLISESTNAKINTLSESEKKIGETLANLFHQIEHRIIVATFASNVYRVQQIIEASVDCGRKVIVFGHSMELTIEAAQKLKYINAPKGWIIRARDLKKIDDTEHVTILCTGSQGEPMAALSRIASGTHKQIKLLPNDTIIYSSKPIPGNEQFVNRNIDKLVHAGAHVIINSSLTDTHTTGHASQMELKLMLAMIRPKYFVPVHGEYAMLRKHIDFAVELGVKKENCFTLNPGDVLALNEKGAKKLEKQIPCNEVYLDSSLSDVDNIVLKERKKMADEGVVCVTFYKNKKNELKGNPQVELKGFSTRETSASIADMIMQKSVDIYGGLIETNNAKNISSLEKQIANQLDQFLYRKMTRRPLFIVSIITL